MPQSRSAALRPLPLGSPPETEFFGLTNGFSTPGIGFVFGGDQDRDFFGRETNNDFAMRAAQNGWLVGETSQYINTHRTTNHSKNFNFRATFEPFKGMRLELSANYLYSENMNENFIWTRDAFTGLPLGYDNFNIKRTLKMLPSDKNTKIVVYCSLGIRSEDIAEKLKKTGYTNIYNLYGGIFEWKNQDNDVINSKGKSTNKVHTFNKEWSKWLLKGEKIYE